MTDQPRPPQHWRYCAAHDIEYKTRSLESTKHESCNTRSGRRLIPEAHSRRDVATLGGDPSL